ncbi:MAG: YjbQ family protein [Candidatus Omnitrophota bacterium]|nr:MAG: YjbQ family protein [Candidatus Omnitrophota bacterium]
MIKEFSISTKSRTEFIDITGKIENIVKDANIKEGTCIVFCPHTTAGITINENADPAVREDIKNYLKSAVPYRASYTHTEGNADAHIKASLLGSSINLLIESGRLKLGTWQGIYFCEFDGPRQRNVFIRVFA